MLRNSCWRPSGKGGEGGEGGLGGEGGEAKIGSEADAGSEAGVVAEAGLEAKDLLWAFWPVGRMSKPVANGQS